MLRRGAAVVYRPYTNIREGPTRTILLIARSLWKAEQPKAYRGGKLSRMPECPAIASIMIAPGAITVPGKTMLPRN
jgi:hypothetical protein